MSDYIASCKLYLNGVEVVDLQGVEEEEVEAAAQVNLMCRTGHINKTPRYKFNADYVRPAGQKSFDFTTIKNGTAVIIDEDGERTTYTGVRYLKAGAKKRDGEKEMMQNIGFGAEKKN